MTYDHVPQGGSLQSDKFTLKTPQQEVDHFYQLLKLSTLAPETYENTRSKPDIFGVSHGDMSKAKRHWETAYDWRKRENHINTFPQWKVKIKDDDGYVFGMHFAALFSNKKGAIPIVLLHGWPGSFLEFLGMFSALKKKYTPENLPYHVVAPSLPSFTLSSGPPLDKYFTTEDIARITSKLMTGLGFESYVAQGGDLGSFACRPLAQYAACKAMHINFGPVSPPKKQDSPLSALEQKGLQRAMIFGARARAYSLEHGTRPATIGFVLQSSPIPLLAWIYEKFITWTDKTPPLDNILDSVTLYWFAKLQPRCIYICRQYFWSGQVDPGPHNDLKYRFEKPFGYSFFPMEVAPMPASWVRASGNLVWHRMHDSGEHFAALEKPDVLLGDVESFVGQVWKV